MTVRRLHDEQPETFAFSAENAEWAERQLAKYPPERRQSAVIPLLWRAQEQEGWLTRPAIEYIADFLDMPSIRVLEVATFYTMFQLHPVGRKAHVQVCGTTPCMLRGSQEIIRVCRKRIAEEPHRLSPDGDFSWEEVECLGACVNAPMVEIGKDTYEDLTPARFEAILDAFAAGRKPQPGPQVDRQFACPQGGPTSLTDPALYDGSLVAAETATPENAPEIAAEATPKSIAGAPGGAPPAAGEKPARTAERKAGAGRKRGTGGKAAAAGRTGTGPSAKGAAAPSPQAGADAPGTRPQSLSEPAGGVADDLKRISGIGPKIEGILNGLGIFHFSQIAGWSAENRAWIDGYLKFKGRIDREKWVEQARRLADGGETEFSRRVDAGDVPSSRD